MLKRFLSHSRTTSAGVTAAAVAAVLASATIGYASTDEANPSIVSVYLWGDAARKLAQVPEEEGGKVLGPARVPYFDNVKLRSLAVSPNVACAVTSDGSLVEWSSPNGQHTIIKKNVKCARLTPNGDRGVALVGGNKVIVWKPEVSPNQASSEVEQALVLFNKDDLAPGQQVEIKDAKLGWFEKIKSISAGEDHVAALTSRGRVLTALIRPIEKHEGQLGLATYPAFDPAPAPYQFHAVSLLPSPVKQLESGTHHVLALLNDGKVYGFGRNTFGQLAQPFSFRTASVSAPVEIKSTAKFIAIAAGGNVSYLRDAIHQQYVAGNGQMGQHGTGSFAHCQVTPLRIKTLENLNEFDETLNKVVTLSPVRWSISNTHSFCQLANIGDDVLAWGQNLAGQIGNGRRSTLPKPQYAQRYGLYNSATGNRVVAGDGISGLFTEA